MGEGERNINAWLVAPHAPLTGDPAHNPGMCPSWESNRQPFDLQAGTPSTEPHKPGLHDCIYMLTGYKEQNNSGNYNTKS